MQIFSTTGRLGFPIAAAVAGLLLLGGCAAGPATDSGFAAQAEGETSPGWPHFGVHGRYGGRAAGGGS